MPWTLTDDDQELYYDVAGDGPGLVFAGGFGGIADVSAAQVAELQDEFTCVTYDLRGYDPCGRSLADELPNARLEVLVDGNHCAMIQRPDWFNEHLRAFARSASGVAVDVS